MNRYKGFALVLLIAFVLMVSLPAAAQDEAPPETAVGMLTINVDGGSLVDNGDGTYTLSLNVTDETIPSVFLSAVFPTVDNIATRLLFEGWMALEEELFVAAVLNGETPLPFVLSVPVYNVEGTLEFTAQYVGEEPKPSETFEETTLFIQWDINFWEALMPSMALLAEQLAAEARNVEPPSGACGEYGWVYECRPIGPPGPPGSPPPVPVCEWVYKCLDYYGGR